jgi:predicted anti-sigma-YlaC factor YlaD
MNHQLYETWILQDPELDQEQQRELHLHLKRCAQCQDFYQAVHQVDHLFKFAPEPTPAPDFSVRWMDRIEQVEKRRTHRILGVTLAGITLATIIMLSVVGLELRSAMDFFPQMMLEIVSFIANGIIFINQISNILSPLVRVGSKFLSPLWVYALTFGLSGITAAWIISSLRSRSLQKEFKS